MSVHYTVESSKTFFRNKVRSHRVSGLIDITQRSRDQQQLTSPLFFNVIELLLINYVLRYDERRKMQVMQTKEASFVSQPASVLRKLITTTRQPPFCVLCISHIGFLSRHKQPIEEGTTVATVEFVTVALSSWLSMEDEVFGQTVSVPSTFWYAYVLVRRGSQRNLT